ncbi:MAG: hypothetical protein Q8T08_17725, partial [Ignavibacteria bacterium]|nr:hypothetical protein [Ignavibacteria bacterium]
FDHKTSISLNDNNIGWSKEAMDFIGENQVPEEVIRMRNRSAILEADNRNNDEKILLYRKLIQLDRRSLDKCGAYHYTGMNDIIRLNISGLLLKMDNPEIPLYCLDKNKTFRIIDGEKIYYINILMQFKSENETLFRRYRLTINRNGIIDLEHLLV